MTSCLKFLFPNEYGWHFKRIYLAYNRNNLTGIITTGPGVKTMKGHYTFSKSSGLESHHQIQLSDIPRKTIWVGSYPSAGDAESVFWTPSTEWLFGKEWKILISILKLSSDISGTGMIKNNIQHTVRKWTQNCFILKS